MRARFLAILLFVGCGSAVGIDAGSTGGGGGSAAGGGTATGGGTAEDAGTPDAGELDAGTPDSGTPDAGDPLSTNRALFFGDSRCADAGLLLCEDFESGAINTQLWTIVGGNAVVIGTADHARGTRALHITKVGNGAAYVKETRTFPAPNNAYFARMFVKFISLPARPMTYAHWTFAAASGTNIAGEVRLSGQLPTNTNAKQLFGVGTDNRTQDAGTGDWTTSDADPPGNPREVPLNEWLCIEWQHDGSANETRFWWDAVEHPSLHTTPSRHGGNTNPFILPTFTNLWVGWQEYQTSTETFDVWVDEVAVSSTRIGCVR